MAGTTPGQRDKHRSQRERIEHLEKQGEKQAALGLKLAKGLDLLNTSTTQRFDGVFRRSNSFGYVFSLVEKAFNARWSIQRWRAKRELLDLVRREGDVEDEKIVGFASRSVRTLDAKDVKGVVEGEEPLTEESVMEEDVHQDGPTTPTGETPEEFVDVRDGIVTEKP